MTHEPSVSVIIPVYNTAPYLDEAFSSVAGQTLTDIEILCVDDGSTDESPAILKKWAEKDARISVIHQENRGLSEARNVAMEKATGKYVYFFDSDDLLAADTALEELTLACERKALDVICFDAEVMIDTDYRSRFLHQGEYPAEARGTELFTHMWENREWYSPVWIQLYRRDYLNRNGIRFIPGILYEDVAFTFEATIRSPKAGYYHRTLYRKRVRENAITTSPVSIQNAESHYINYLRIKELTGELWSSLSSEQKTLFHSLAEESLANARLFYGRTAPLTEEKLPEWEQLPGFFEKVIRQINDDKLSVVALFCNQEKDLSRCLESILRQTYRNIEVICIDDASTDGTRERLTDYRRDHGDLRVYRFENNSSLHLARKKGVELATGKYLLFVDGDDWLEENTAEILIKEIREDPADILHFDAVIENAGCLPYAEISAIAEKKRPLMQRLSGDRVFKECYETGHYCFNLWGKLFDTRLLKKAFDLVEEIPLPFGQDKYEYFILSHLARSYRGIARKLYHYSAGNGISTMEEMDLRSFRRICTISEVADTAEHYAQSCGDPHVQDAVFDFRYQAVQDCISKAAFLQGGVWAGLETLLSRFSMPLVCAAIAQMYRGTEKNLIAAMEAPVEDFSANRRIRTVAAFYPSLRSGGAQRVTAALTRVWQEAGYHVILFTEENESTADYSIPDDVTRILLPKVHAEDDTSGYERARFLQQSLCDQEVDLMVYHDWFGRNLLLDLMVCKLCRIHFVIHCHNYFSRISLVDPDRFENMLYIYTLADGVVTLSDTDTAFWKQFHDTVFQTVNPMQFRTVEEIPQSPCDGYTVIWCQRISPEKNPMAALEVFGLVHDQLPDARMLLLGEAKDPAWDELIRSYLADRGLTDAVTCLGYRKNVEAYYRKASVCIMTSEVEGFPLGLMESMGAGVPVVMYALPYLTIVQKGKGILSVRKHDTHSMAREVIGLLTDDARRKQLGREARESIAEILRIDLPGRWTGFFERIESEPHIPRPIPILWQTMLEHFTSGYQNMVIRKDQIINNLKSEQEQEMSRLTAVQKQEMNRLTAELEKEKARGAALRNAVAAHPTEMICQLAQQDYDDWSAAFRAVRDKDLFLGEKREIRTIASFFYRLRSGGTERVMANLAGLWTEMGYRVVLFTEEEATPEDYQVPPEVTRVVLPSTWDVTREDYHRRAKRLKQAIIDHEVDLVVCHAWISPILMWDLLTCRWSGARFVIHCHNIFSQIAIYDPVLYGNLPYAYALADGVVTLSRTDTAYWSNFHDTVFQTVNPTQFSSVEEIPQSPLEGKTVIWCQRFSEEKHPQDAIEIFRMVHYEVPDAKLLILGKGEKPQDTERLKQLAEQAGLSHAVTFCGYQKNVEDYYRQADVCLITSDYEGFPLGMIESMGAGVPVVMYELPYLTITENGRGVVSVPGRDKAQMADRVIGLLNSPERKKRLGQEAREAIRELLSFDYQGEWQRFFDRLESGDHEIREIPLLWDTLFGHYRAGIGRLREAEHAHAKAYGDELNDTYTRTVTELQDARYQLSEIRKSRSFIWGRALTLIPRWIRHVLTGFPM